MKISSTGACSPPQENGAVWCILKWSNLNLKVLENIFYVHVNNYEKAVGLLSGGMDWHAHRQFRNKEKPIIHINSFRSIYAFWQLLIFAINTFSRTPILGINAFLRSPHFRSRDSVRGYVDMHHRIKCKNACHNNLIYNNNNSILFKVQISNTVQ